VAIVAGRVATYFAVLFDDLASLANNTGVI
jgi:hypothetical protein